MSIGNDSTGTRRNEGAGDDLLRALDELAALLQRDLGPERGREWARRLRDLVDLLALDVRSQIRPSVAPWALAGSQDLIPLEKLDREGIRALVQNPAVVPDEALVQVHAARLEAH